MNIKQRMAKIRGVAKVDWNADEQMLTIHYRQGTDVDVLKTRILASIEEANLQNAVEKYAYVEDEPSLFSLIENKGFVPKPFEATFVNAKTEEEAEHVFRQDHKEQDAQIDEIQVNKFCAMVIYHDPKIPTV